MDGWDRQIGMPSNRRTDDGRILSFLFSRDQVTLNEDVSVLPSDGTLDGMLVLNQLFLRPPRVADVIICFPRPSRRWQLNVPAGAF